MNKYVLACTIGLILSCSSEKKLSKNNYDCPEENSCFLNLEKNKSLSYVYSENDGLLISKLPNNNQSIYIYEFSRKVAPEIMDGNYKEQVIFELPNNLNQLELLDENLEKLKLTFGRFCYCKGYTGYYKIKKGSFSLKNNQVTISFEVPETPHLLNKITFKIK